MKKIVFFVSFVVLCASYLRAASFAGLSAETAKPWTASITLRGFYDDNVNSTHTDQTETFGAEISPSLAFHWGTAQTAVQASYTYAFKWYDDKPPGNADDYDQNHTFNIGLSHVFTPRWQMSLGDSFVIGQEPDTLRAQSDPIVIVYQRIPGDNIRNYGFITLNGQITPLFGLEFGYQNSFFDYDDSGTDFDFFGNVLPSLSGLLDRVEHSGHVHGRFQIQPNTVGILGYTFRENNYTADEVISNDGHRSDVRDSRMHYIYLGAEHTFRPDFIATAQAGASFIDYYNDPSGESDVAPYVQATLTYLYRPDSSLTAGFKYDRNATDLFDPTAAAGLTQDAQSAVFWLSIAHHFTPRISGSLVGQIQNSSINGGTFNETTDLYYLFGINLEYRFNTYLAAHVGYNFDRLDSDLPGRDFDRNRVYMGITASY
jgi:hypothetical protein